MSIGTSIVLIAVGAILKYAVTVSVQGVELETVGTILLILGIVGLAISLIWMFALTDRRGRRDPVDDAPTARYRERDRY